MKNAMKNRSYRSTSRQGGNVLGGESKTTDRFVVHVLDGARVESVWTATDAEAAERFAIEQATRTGMAAEVVDQAAFEVLHFFPAVN